MNEVPRQPASPATRLLAVAVLGAAAVACSGGAGDPMATQSAASPAPFVLVSGTASVPTPRARVTGTPVILPTPQPIAADDEVWRNIAADMVGNVRPLLRPPSLPAGLETVLDKRPSNRPTTGSFYVEYAGPGKMLVIAAGPLNTPPGFEPGYRGQVTVRGQRGVLAVGDDRDPGFSSWVSWEEPGSWAPQGTQAARSGVSYFVQVRGASPEELLAIVEALQPWLPE